MIFIVIFIIFSLLPLAGWLLLQDVSMRNRWLSALFLLLGLIMTLVAGLRAHYGRDLANYEYMFTAITTINEAMTHPVESGYALLNYTVKLVGGDFSLFIFLMAGLAMAGKMVAVGKLSRLPTLSLLLYLLVYFISSDMEQLRMALASSLFLLALLPLLKGARAVFAVMAVVAATIHISAAAGLLMLLWDKVALRARTFVFASGAALLVGLADLQLIARWISELLHSDRLIEKIILYQDSDISMWTTIAVRIIVLAGFIAFAYRKSIARHRMLLYGYALSIILPLALADISILAVRSSLFFKMMDIIILPEIAYYGYRAWGQTASSRRLLLLLFGLFIVGYSVYNFYRLVMQPDYYHYGLIG